MQPLLCSLSYPSLSGEPGGHTHTQTHTYTQESRHESSHAYRKCKETGKIKAWLGCNTSTYRGFYCWASCMRHRIEHRSYEGMRDHTIQTVISLDLWPLLTPFRNRHGDWNADIYGCRTRWPTLHPLVKPHWTIMYCCRYEAVGKQAPC